MREIYVFGSNLRGFHGKGSAAYAVNHYKAIMGVGVGIQGDAYAIPTKGHTLDIVLDLDTIKLYVDDFLLYAKRHPELKFIISKIGCGYAGYTPQQIAPLFRNDLPNVILNSEFQRVLEN
jgi:hypothetical protein